MLHKYPHLDQKSYSTIQIDDSSLGFYFAEFPLCYINNGEQQNLFSKR